LALAGNDFNRVSNGETMSSQSCPTGIAEEKLKYSIKSNFPPAIQQPELLAVA